LIPPASARCIRCGCAFFAIMALGFLLSNPVAGAVAIGYSLAGGAAIAGVACVNNET
jgi:hypothetical protein